MISEAVTGWGRVVRGAVCAGLALVAVMMMASSAQAQLAVAPADGDGTALNPYQVSELGNLVWIGNNAGDSSNTYYRLTTDLDATVTAGWNANAGFAPIGTDVTPFRGIFDGNGKVISNLSINRPAQEYVGFFGYVGSSGIVKDLGLAGCSVTGGYDVGGLVGINNGGTVSNCYATGAVAVRTDYAGGLVGYNYNGVVIGCYATGSASGSNDVGGLVGLNSYGTVRGCYATGPAAVSNDYVGGLVGINNRGMVSGCYASGSTTGRYDVGGLVGMNTDGGTVTVCYATGPVMGSAAFGGLVGYSDATVSSSYWDTNSTGQATSSGGTGKTTAQMKRKATFAGWDFTNVWGIAENVTYPQIQQATRRPVLSWTTTPGATWYYLWINRNGTVYSKKWLHQAVGTWTPTTDLPAGTYVWWVMPYVPALGNGAWSSASAFALRTMRPSAVTLVSPETNAPAGTIVYKWIADPSATHYELLINRNGSKWFDKWYNTGRKTGLITNAVPGHTAGATYAWYVRGWDPDGNGPWSAGKTFACGKCVATAPVTNAVVTISPPELTWIGFGTATGYELWINLNGTKYLDELRVSPSTSWTPASAWPNGSYRWWVREITGAKTGVWSSAASFSISVP